MARRWQISTSRCWIAWGCMWIHSATAMARSKTSLNRCPYRGRVMDWRRIEKVRRTDPLPPSLDASPYRARASRAALPLCEGENEPVHFTTPFSPSVRGSRERGGRSADFLCKALFLLIFGLAATSLAAEKPSLADAAEHRNRTLLRTLLDSGADVNAAQADGTTALHWAVYNDDAETAALLVKRGANVNAANRYGVPPLSLACTNGNADMVKLLLDAGADANASLPGGETVLMTAARAGNLEAVKALLARGANSNAREQLDQTALMWAAAEGHAAVVQALIDGGADVRAKLKSGFTPLFFAVREGHIDATRTLLKAGVDVNETSQREEKGPVLAVNDPVRKGTSPLLMAVENGHF